MKAELARAHARGIDTVQKLDTSACRWLIQHQYDFVVRYLHGRYAITSDEMQRILYSGLALMLCTPSRISGWTPSSKLGDEDGQTALVSLEDLMVPMGSTVWLDLEGCVGPADQTSAWINMWSLVLRSEGHEAGLYVGHQPGELDSESLWKLPHITRYWRSGSRVPEPANRGWCMQQLRPLDVDLGPMHVDHDIIEADFRGGLPTWIVA